MLNLKSTVDCITKEPVKWATSNQTNAESSMKHGEEIRFTCKHQADVYYDVTCENGIFNTDEVVCYPRKYLFMLKYNSIVFQIIRCSEPNKVFV